MGASDRNGFTLIELSIVLVIIGLIVGGILVGRDLIRAAELRGDIRQTEKMDAAVNTFRLKYNCVPGDCANATQFLEGAHNGNGNGLIEGTVDPDGTMSVDGEYGGTERAHAIDQIGRAKLFAVIPFEADPVDEPAVVPQLHYGRGFVVLAELFRFSEPDGTYKPTGRHTYRLGVRMDVDGEISTDPPPYTPSDAYWIDSKIDDGHATSGRVTAAAENLPASLAAGLTPADGFFHNGVCGGGPDRGVDPSTCEYDLTLKNKLVGLFVRASF